MTPAEAIRRCATVAECHALRASLDPPEAQRVHGWFGYSTWNKIRTATHRSQYAA
jgi:hypothetical protein